MERIGFIQIHPAPYRDTTFKIASENSNYNIEFITLYAEADNHKEWDYKGLEYNKKFLNRRKKIPLLGDYHFEIESILSKGNYDVIFVSGYYPLTCLRVIFYCIKNSIPYVYCADTIASGKHFFMKDKLLNYIYQNAAAFWVTGKASSDYFQKEYKICVDKIFQGYYMEVSVMLNKSIDGYAPNRENYRKEYGISNDDFLFLFVGKLVSNRKIENLTKAMKLLVNSNIKLIIIGDGEESYKLNGYEYDNIIHIPQVSLDELSKFYCICDGYVHPGHEPYSLATVEAVIAGKPIVATIGVGSVHDYLLDGENGYIVVEDDINDLVEKLKLISNKKYDNKKIKEQQKLLLNTKTNTWAALQLITAADYALKNSKTTKINNMYIE